MTQTRRRLALMGTLLSLFTASPVWAWHIRGHVYCDQDGNQMIDAGDTPLAGVGILITALTVAPGGTFPATTDAGGAFTTALPDHTDDYRVKLTGTGLPAGANILVPSSGAYGVPPVAALHLELSPFEAVADFLVNGCVATPSPSATPTPSATTTPTPTPTDTPIPSATATPSNTQTPPPSVTPTPTPSDTPTPTASPTPDASVLDFQCYEIDHSTAPPITGVSVVDRFGSATIDLDSSKRVKRLCNPAITGANGTTPPTVPDHLVGYVISQRTPPFSQVFDQTIVNQFGTTVVRVVRPVLLLVPSAKSLSAPPPPLDEPLIDHFLCYAVRGGHPHLPNMHVVDQFGATTYKVMRASRLCTAVDKGGEGVLDPQANLLCYDERTAPGLPVFHGTSGPAFVANPFGSNTLTVNRPRELCVPSSVNPE